MMSSLRLYRNFDTIIKPDFNLNHALFLLLVHSEVQEHDRRRIIRETYGRMALDNNVFLVFNVGRTPEDLTSRFQTELVAESDENRDILQHNIIEHPWNLTLLALEGLQWYQAEYSTSIPYILHLRSDTFVDVRKWSYIFSTEMLLQSESTRSNWFSCTHQLSKRFNH